MDEDHLSHLRSLFGGDGDSTQEESMRRPIKGWSQLIRAKQAEFNGGDVDEGAAAGGPLNLSSKKSGDGEGSPPPSSPIILPLDDEAPLSPCFIRGSQLAGGVSVFTSADLPLVMSSSHRRFLRGVSPRSEGMGEGSPPFKGIPDSQGTIENVASPPTMLNLPNVNVYLSCGLSGKKSHHHRHHPKSHYHHHHRPHGEKKRKGKNKGGDVFVGASCTGTNPNNTEDMMSRGGQGGQHKMNGIGNGGANSPFKMRRLTSILDSPEKHGTKMRRLSPYNYNYGHGDLPGGHGERKRKGHHKSKRGRSLLEERLTANLNKKRGKGAESSSGLIYTSERLKSPSPSPPPQEGTDVFRTPEKPKRKKTRVIIKGSSTDQGNVSPINLSNYSPSPPTSPYAYGSSSNSNTRNMLSLIGSGRRGGGVSTLSNSPAKGDSDDEAVIVIPETPPPPDKKVEGGDGDDLSRLIVEELDSPLKNKSPSLSPVVIRRSRSMSNFDSASSQLRILLGDVVEAAAVAAMSKSQTSFWGTKLDFDAVAKADEEKELISPFSSQETSTTSSTSTPRPPDLKNLNNSTSDSNSQLSCRISEEQSTQEDLNRSLSSLTPIGRWMHQDTEKPMEIEEIDSELVDVDILNPSTRNLSNSSFNLIDQLSTILGRYDSSVRMFPHDLRSNKFKVDDGPSSLLKLLVRKIDVHVNVNSNVNIAVGNDAHKRNGLWTICSDMESGEFKVVLFRGRILSCGSDGLKVGSLVELYPPWKVLKKVDNVDIIVGADFCRVVSSKTLRKKEEERLGELTPVPESLQETLSLVGYTEELNKSLVNLLPEEVGGAKRCLREQFGGNCGRTEVALDEVEILKQTKDMGMWIVEDKEGVACVIKFEGEELRKKLGKGSVVTFEKLEVLKKIKEKENGVLFSVLRVLVEKKESWKPFVYLLKFTGGSGRSQLEGEEGKEDCTFVKIHKEVNRKDGDGEVLCERKFIHEIRQMMEEMGNESSDEVRRVSVVCLVMEMAEEGKFSIEDRLGYSMEINCTAAAEGELGAVANGDGGGGSSPSFVTLDFLRVSGGGELPIFDELSVLVIPAHATEEDKAPTAEVTGLGLGGSS